MLISNTPSAIRLMMDTILDISIEHFNSRVDRRDSACKAVADMIIKVGDRALIYVMGSFMSQIRTGGVDTKIGVCMALKTIFEYCEMAILNAHFELLIPAIKLAICDDNDKVRDEASNAYLELHKSMGNRVINDTLPEFLDQMEDPDITKSSKALLGLKQMLVVKPQLILPSILPKLLAQPLTSFNIKSLASISQAAGQGLNPHISKIIQILMKALFLDNKGNQVSEEELNESLHIILKTIRGEGSAILFKELTRLINDNSPRMRKGSLEMISDYVKEISDLEEFVSNSNNLIGHVLRGYHDRSNEVVKQAISSMEVILSFISSDDMSNEPYIEMINDTIDSFRTTSVEGFEYPEGLATILPFYVHIIRTGTSEGRLFASYGLRLILERSSQEALTPVILQTIVGPLIRILSERLLESEVRADIFLTMNLLLDLGGSKVSKFAMTLQTTYMKSIVSTNRSVRVRCAKGIKKLIELGAKIDMIIKDVMKFMKDSSLESSMDGCLMVVAMNSELIKSKISETNISAIEDMAKEYLDSDDSQLKHASSIALSRLKGEEVEIDDEE